MSRFVATAVCLAGCSRVVSVQIPLPESGESAIVAVERGSGGSSLGLFKVALIDVRSGEGSTELEISEVADDEVVEFTAALYSVPPAQFGLEAGPLTLSEQRADVTSDPFDTYRLHESTLFAASFSDGETSSWTELPELPDRLANVRLDRPDFCGSLTFQRFEIDTERDAVAATVTARGSALVSFGEEKIVEVEATERGLELTSPRVVTTASTTPAWSAVLRPGSDEILFSDSAGRVYAGRLTGDELRMSALTSSVVANTLYFMSAMGDEIVALTLRGRVLYSRGLQSWIRIAEFPPYIIGDVQFRYARGRVVFDADGSAVIVGNVEYAYRARNGVAAKVERADPPLLFAEALTTLGFVEGWGMLVGTSHGRIFVLEDRELSLLAQFPRELVINEIAPFSEGRVFLGGVDGVIGVLERSSTGAATLLHCETHGDYTIRFMTPLGEGRWVLSGIRPPAAPRTVITEMSTSAAR
ncbi:MAG: hypothetical protein HY791_01735 [Deltaproteobacteria bacterium]|nr:hypothetical protein [Deltaproteobacteria bacterium]